MGSRGLKEIGLVDGIWKLEMEFMTAEASKVFILYSGGGARSCRG